MKYAFYFIDVDSRTMALHIQSLWVNLVLFVSFSCHSGHDVAPHTPFLKNAYCDCGVQGPTKCFALPPKGLSLFFSVYMKFCLFLFLLEQSTTAIASSGGESFDWAISSAKSLLLFFIILVRSNNLLWLSLF
jgi:hypothetical protein